MTSRHPGTTGTKNKELETKAESRETRNSSDSRPKKPGRTASTEQLLVPSTDMATQRRRRDSLNQGRHTSCNHLSQKMEDAEDARARTRKLSSTERVYPSPEAAKEAFRAERADNPMHRRAPTPYTSSRRSSESLKRIASDRSIRSKVSFDSTRSRGSHRSQRTYHTDSSGNSDAATVAGLQPHFGSTTGVGPAGEAIEVIGLGRKKPRHRTFQSTMLKPALRSGSRLASRTDLSRHGSRTAAPIGEGTEKPLPSRPLSHVAPIVGTFSRFTSANPYPGRASHSRHASHQPTGDGENEMSSVSYSIERDASRDVSRSQSRTHSRSASAQVQPTGFRSLFSSLSIADPSPLLPQTSSRATKLPHTLAPADNLFDYLRRAEVPSWERWPPSAPEQNARSKLFWGGRSKGLDAMGWEWHRRLQLAEASRTQGRALMQWEAAGSRWAKGILEFQDENVPVLAIDPDNRWGSQIFALYADGYDSLEFFDEMIHRAEDNGLLSWITGTLLQTAVSTLHMLRHSSQSFTFHLIPAPRPPISSHFSFSLSEGYREPNAPAHRTHFLWEGFGTMVLVNKSNDDDRAMVLEIRPPSVVDSSVMKEFARGKGAEQWWSFHGETCVGDVGQANLLQAQVYDDCVQNQVYYFAVTNLKCWVFGQFDSNYTRCTVSPVIERKARDPSVMQCLSAWVIRSVDERPWGDFHSNMSTPYDQSRSQTLQSYSQDRHRQDVPPYSDHRSWNRTVEPHQLSQADFSPTVNGCSDSAHGSGLRGGQYPLATVGGMQTVYPASPTPSPMANQPRNFNSVPSGFRYTQGLPGYYDLPPPPGSPYPYSQPQQTMGMGMNYGWGGGQRAFSPTPTGASAQQMPYNMGLSWYGGGMFSWPGMR